MGFSTQPNLWQCGPFALKHALIMLGIFVDEKEISRIAGSNKWSGTDEIQLARAARKFGCNLLVMREHDPDAARRKLVTYLRDGNPCLVCAYDWTHWVTVVKEERGRFIVLDSREDAVLALFSWNKFKKVWVYRKRDEDNDKIVDTVYDFHPVAPRFRVQTRARFSLERAKYLRRPENRNFARHWDEYVEDLLALWKPRTPLSSNVISLGEFLRRHAEMIVDQLSFWHGGVERRRAERVLQNMHFVADTYGLVIHEEDEKRAIAGITVILSLWAGGKYGVKPVYQKLTPPEAPRQRRLLPH
ncbi:MAG: hypothetical protein DMG09_26860 [Acidobacteria bacterium]|nr:MAG: hypothetical protein DMG09_26860 [Acidobacteriota bacterium]